MAEKQYESESILPINEEVCLLYRKTFGFSVFSLRGYALLASTCSYSRKVVSGLFSGSGTGYLPAFPIVMVFHFFIPEANKQNCPFVCRENQLIGSINQLLNHLGEDMLIVVIQKSYYTV